MAIHMLVSGSLSLCKAHKDFTAQAVATVVPEAYELLVILNNYQNEKNGNTFLRPGHTLQLFL